MRNDWATAKEAGLECSHAWLHLTARGERNPKSEIRNKFKIRTGKVRNQPGTAVLNILNFSL